MSFKTFKTQDGVELPTSEEILAEVAVRLREVETILGKCCGPAYGIYETLRGIRISAEYARDHEATVVTQFTDRDSAEVINSLMFRRIS